MELLDEYNHYLKRLDKAMEYNDTVKAIELGSKEYKVLLDIIIRLSELEKEIKEK